MSGGVPSANQGTGRMDVGMPGENLIVISGSLSSASQTTYEFDPAAGNGGFIVASFDAALAAALKRSAYRSVRRTCSAGRVAVRRTRHARAPRRQRHVSRSRSSGTSRNSSSDPPDPEPSSLDSSVADPRYLTRATSYQLVAGRRL